MANDIAKVLGPLEGKDHFLAGVVEKMVDLLDGADVAEDIADVTLHVSDYRFAPPSFVQGRYFTNNCAALRTENAVLVNEDYLLETEAAVRSFGLAGELSSIPYLRSDEDLFGLVSRLSDDPRSSLGRLRALTKMPGADGMEQEIENGMVMLLLFLVGHELGHLRAGHDQRAFGAFVSPDASPEVRVGNSVVKLARHARELSRLGFDLPGFDDAIDESSEIGRNEANWRNAMGDVRVNHERWFEDESAADAQGAALVQDVLDRVAKKDPDQSDRLLLEASKALFSMALYHWQRDLAAFLAKLGIEKLANARDLVFAMMRRRETYVHAAELFGEVHRFTLLRAVLAMDGWLHARGVFSEPIDMALKRSAPPSRTPLDAEIARACIRRKVLLQIHLDTAVKISHVGAATGWMLEMDEARGTPQIFTMFFESISRSVERLRQIS